MGKPKKGNGLPYWRPSGLNPLRGFSRGGSNTSKKAQDPLPKTETVISGSTSKGKSGPRKICGVQESEQSDDGYVDVSSHGETGDPSSKQSGFSSRSVMHPWGVVDSHLYLNHIYNEKGLFERRSGMLVFDGPDSFPVFNDETSTPQISIADLFSGDSTVLFECLPIPETDSSLEGAQYVLGLDLASHQVFARRFSFTPGDVRELRKRWIQGTTVYKFSGKELYEIMKRSLGRERKRAILPDVASDGFCMAPENREEPGMEMAILLRCCQFVADILEMPFFMAYSEDIGNIGLKMARVVADWRFILEQASSKAWIAVRNGMSRMDYITQSQEDRMIYDLYSLRSPEREDKELSVEQAGEYDGDCSEESTESPFLEIPQSSNRKSSGHVTKGLESASSTTPSGDMFLIDIRNRSVPHIEIPLSDMLEELVDLMDGHPEIDTDDNRRRLGQFLGDIQKSLGYRQSRRIGMRNAMRGVRGMLGSLIC